MKDFLKEVIITGLNVKGHVLMFREAPGFTQYFVRYWFDGKICEEWLYPHEIGL